MSSITDPSQISQNKRVSAVNGRMTITEVSEKVGVTTKTIVRWEKSGKINKPKRDWKGWRFYSEDDLASILQWVNTVYE